MSGQPIEITGPRHEERALVTDTWRKSMQDDPSRRKMPTRAYTAWANDIIEGFLGADSDQIDLDEDDVMLVARDAERPKYVYGWLLISRLNRGLAGIWLYVKKPHRRQGVAKALIDQALMEYGLDEDGNALEWFYTQHSRFDEVWERRGLDFMPVQQIEYAEAE